MLPMQPLLSSWPEFIEDMVGEPGTAPPNPAVLYEIGAEVVVYGTTAPVYIITTAVEGGEGKDAKAKARLKSEPDGRPTRLASSKKFVRVGALRHRWSCRAWCWWPKQL